MKTNNSHYELQNAKSIAPNNVSMQILQLVWSQCFYQHGMKSIRQFIGTVFKYK